MMEGNDIGACEDGCGRSSWPRVLQLAREVHVIKRRCSNAVNAIRLWRCRRTDMKMFTEPSAKREGSRDVKMFHTKLSASAKKLYGKERTLRAS